MADFNFPSAPNTNDLYTLNGITYRYDGSRWRYANASVVTITGGNAVTTFNSLQSSNQDFAVGYSGSTLNILSSGNTHTFNIPLAGNATTGLVSGNAQTIYGVKTFNSALIASDSTNSTSTTTGAVTVTGGAGIGQSVSVGGRLQLFNSANYTAFVSSASGNTVYTLPATSPATGSSVLQSTSAGVMSWVPMTASSSGTTSANINVVLANSNTNHPLLFTPTSGSASGVAVSSNSTLVYNPFTDILTVSGLAVTVGTASTSFSTGALVVTGGVGIGGSVYVQGDLTINGTTTTINSTTLTVDDKNIELGSVSVPSDVTAEAGGITLKGATDKSINWYAGSGWSSSESWNLSAGNTYKINNTTVISNSSIGTGITNSSLTALGTISTGTWAATAITAHYGGTGLQSPFVVGDLIYANTTTTWARVAAGTAGSILTSAGAGTTPYWSAPSAGGGGAGTVYSSLINTFAYYNITGTGVTGLPNFVNTGSGIALSFGTNSTSTTTGSISIRGGIGVTGNAYIGGTTNITNTTSSTNSSSGALVVSGGVGVGGSVFIENRLVVSSSTASTNTTTGAVLIAGGVGISGQLTFTQASLGFTGIATNPSMSFIGATTSSPITLTVLTDNSLNWEGSQGSVFSIDSNLSTGEIFSVSDISGLPIISASAGQTVNMNEFGGFTQIGNGSLNSSSTATGSLVISGGVGITGNAFIGGTTTVTNTTASVSSSSGALVVAGGVGIGQTLFIGGNLYQNTNAITAHSTGFRNRIINGDFNIDQRNSGATVVPSSTQNVTDRWKMNINGSGRVTSGQNYGGVATPSPFVSYYGMKVTTTTTPGSGDYNFFSQVIEGPNINDLQWGNANAQTVTLSFWAYSSLTGTFGGSVRNFGGFNRSYPFTYAISSANTWEKKTVVIPGDTTGTWTVSTAAGIELIFIIANGSTFQSAPGAWAAGNFHGPSGSLANLIGTLNSTLYITGVQIELGTAATPFEKRNYGHEFSLCQRYYQITEVRVGGYHTTDGQLRGSAYLNTAMRPIASPVFTVLATDESVNLGTLFVDNSNFRGDSYRFITAVTTTGTAYGQWKVSADCEF